MTVTLERHIDDSDLETTLRADVRHGLSARPKTLPPRWFYDARGSTLFERITALPEYYQTRAETAILRSRAADIGRLTGAKNLVDLGSGSCTKTRLLLDGLRDHASLGAFTAFDVSETALRESLEALAGSYPGITLHGVIGDFTRHLRHLPRGGRRLVAFLGGTIGNLLPRPRALFLAELREQLEVGEWLLVGCDLVKDPDTLRAAYDDATGVTAEFNRNVLRVLNHRLRADFVPEDFAHVAAWDARHEWIEMRLRAQRAMRVAIPGAGLETVFAAGEEVRTEVSAKFRSHGVSAELRAAGFRAHTWWTDRGGAFGVALAHAV